MLIEDIKKHMLLDNYIITFHAHRRMDERGISVLITGIASYRCCHAVVALCENHLRIVTVYWPEDGEWIDHMTRRKS